MNNKYLYIIIAVLLLVIVGGAAYFIGWRQVNTGTVGGEQTPTATPVDHSPSGQIDQVLFNEYFSSVSLVNLPEGTKPGPGMSLKQSSAFNLSAGDQFCVSMDVVKTITTNIMSIAVYDNDTGSYAINKQRAGGPPTLSVGNNFGCESLYVSQDKLLAAGNYEYELYLDNTLVAVLPFTVQ
ncbi:MAG: hypothetical protein M1361_02145 [Patescibacteria group bacterium]|nr:hypothetical protein [Patescibacteria group bacterium]MCL5224382.1 hypothetical protein [Patescibacteria group bacterium]